MPPRTKGFPPHTGSGSQVPQHRPPAAALVFLPFAGRHIPGDTPPRTRPSRQAPSPNAQRPMPRAHGRDGGGSQAGVGSLCCRVLPLSPPLRGPHNLALCPAQGPRLRLCLRCPDPGRRRPRACDSASLAVRGLALCLMTQALLPDVLTGAAPTVPWGSSRRFVRAQGAALISTICLSH